MEESGDGNATPRGAGSREASPAGSPAKGHESFKDKLERAKKRKSASVERVLPTSGKHFHQKAISGEDGAYVDPATVKEDCTLYVGNLDWSITQQQLIDMFQTINGLKDTRLVCDFMERSKGYAYLDYETSEQVKEAAEKYNGHEINGRPMKVAPSKPTKQLYDEKIVFVKLVPDTATEEMLQEYFAECGSVVGVRVPTFIGCPLIS